MESSIGDTAFLSVESAARRNVCLDAEDWLDMAGLGFCIELDGAEHISVVGYGYGGHSQFFAALEQSVDGYGTIKQ
jgi:hypothetical protein